MTWGKIHNMISNPSNVPIEELKRIRSGGFSRSDDLALKRLVGVEGVESLVPAIDDWNVLLKMLMRPENVIDRMGENTGKYIVIVILIVS